MKLIFQVLFSLIVTFVVSCGTIDDDQIDDPILPELPNNNLPLNKILFEASTSNTPNISQLFTINTDGSNEIQITNFSHGQNSIYTGNANWSPDGNEIIFTSNKDGNLDIYLMDSEGNNITRLTNNLRGEQYPTYSPNGDKILFEAGGDGNANSQLFTMNTDGSNEIQITNFSNGENRVYTGNANWSPDGRKIVFTSNKNGNLNIYSMDSEGKNITRLTNDDRGEQHPSYSPNGDKILFEASVDSNDNSQIFIMNSDGTNEIQITNFSNGENRVYTGNANWSPDGTKIVFTSNKDGNLNIYSMDSEGNNITRLTNNVRGEQHPKWK